MMLTGAFVAVTGSYYTDNILIAAVTAMLAGGLLSMVHAYVTITRGANQIISGAAINLLALGLTNFLYRALLGGASRKRVVGFPEWKIPGFGEIPIIGPLLFDHSVIVYVAYIAPAVFAWVLFRTTWGLDVRAVGEYPVAADTAGVSVAKVRYLSVFLSGMMAGLGGAALALGAVRYFTPGMTAGRGFIVLGAIIFGKWNPILVALACLFFGAADAFQLRAQTFGFEIPHQFLLMLPYLLTIAAMVGFIGRTRPPQSLGIPYRGQEASA
jgi:simple sugar transport system permease protein